MTDTVYPPVLIVDEKDRVIGEAQLPEAYANGLIIRVVVIVVYDQNDQVLLQKRGPNLLTNPNHWDVSAAGSVDVGETYIQAAKRELKEELGLKGFPLEEVYYDRGDFEYQGKLLKRFMRVYRIVIPTETPIIPSPDEVSQVKWYSMQELRLLLTGETDQVVPELSEILSRAKK